ncbi:MAG: hypothetical protein KTR25_17900 [Myxococcales bacterium]|nr:hypothetical protein [Myxococcales bacterium]
MGESLEIDFVVYLGDPEDGASAVSSQKLLDDGLNGTSLEWPVAYGAVTVTKGDKELIERFPDPIFKLVSHMVRAVHSLIDGDSETIGFIESEHGFLFEPSGEDVMVSFYVGDAYDPDEYLLTEALVPLEGYAHQVLKMGERLRDLVKMSDPDLFDRDEYSQSLLEFLKMSNKSFTSFRREKERGLR